MTYKKNEVVLPAIQSQRLEVIDLMISAKSHINYLTNFFKCNYVTWETV